MASETALRIARTLRDRFLYHPDEITEAAEIIDRNLATLTTENERLTRERDKLWNEVQDYYNRLGTWQESTGCSHGAAAKTLIEALRASLPLNDNRTRNEAEKLLGAQVAQYSGRITDGGPELIAWYYPAKETREVVVSLLAENAALRSRLTDAMRFVPSPEEMSGFSDPECPPEVRELIDAARRLRADTTEPASSEKGE